MELGRFTNPRVYILLFWRYMKSIMVCLRIFEAGIKRKIKLTRSIRRSLKGVVNTNELVLLPRRPRSQYTLEVSEELGI